MKWLEFLDDNHIYYVDRGPNTRKGEVSIQCPWCGSDDPSQHLGISLEKEVWGCHRNMLHRGQSPVRLIKELLHCSNSQAVLIAAQYSQSDPDQLEIPNFGAVEEVPHHGPDSTLKLFVEFADIKTGTVAQKFYDYLLDRGFHDPEELAEQYNLKASLLGRWKDRIIIPIYREGELIAWTGRALGSPVSAPRYLSTSNAIKTTVYNEDLVLSGGKLLIITEGPFDALKLDFYGSDLGATATCLFGTALTIDQISILKEAAPKYDKVVILLDNDAIEPAFITNDWLPLAITGTIPEGAKDPGELDADEVRSLISSYL